MDKQYIKEVTSSFLLTSVFSLALMLCLLKLVGEFSLIIPIILVLFIFIQSLVNNHKHFFYFMLGELIIFAGVLFTFLNTISNGMLITINLFFQQYNNLFDDYIQYYATQGINNTTFIIILLCVISVGISLLIRSKKSVIINFIAFVLVFISVFFQLYLNVYCIMIMVFAILMIWFDMRSLKYELLHKIKVEIPIFLLLSIFIVVSTLYTPSSLINNVKNTINQTVEDVRYGSDTLPLGQLDKYEYLVSGSGDTLSLSFDKVNSIYLKGYIGSEYDDNQWKSLSKKVYYEDYSGMIDWLSSQGFDSQKQFSLFNEVNKKYSAIDRQEYSLVIDNVGASRKYVYVPYGLEDMSADVSKYYDYGYTSSSLFGAGSYTLKAVNDQTKGLITSPTWLESLSAHKYVKSEDVYRYFVYDQYTKIDDKDKEMIDSFFYQDKIEDKDAYSVLTRIRTILQLTTTYTESPKSYHSSDDFVHWFLSTSKEGNSISYASAAVLAFRSQGIPARYVEGYYLSDDKVSQMKDNNKTDITLTSKDAHAWAEIYIDGVGWQPVEVTPGFYTSELPVSEVIGVPEKKPVAVDPNKDPVDNFIEYTKTETPTMEEAVKTSVLYISIIMLVVAGIISLLELQRFSRIRYLRSLYKKSNSKKKRNIEYEYLTSLFVLMKISKESMAFPYNLDDNILAIDPNVDITMYHKVIGLFQKSEFGEEDLLPYEERIILIFISELNETIRKNITLKNKFIYRYVYCLK